MRCQFGFAVTGKQTFLIALNTQHRLRSHEVREVPGLLADDKCKLIEDLVVHLIVVDLIFLGIHNRRSVVDAHNGIRTVLSEHQRLAQLFPCLKLRAQRFFRSFQIGPAKIPAIVAVQADHIGELCGNVGIGTAGHLDADQRAGTFLRIQCPRQLI